MSNKIFSSSSVILALLSFVLFTCYNGHRQASVLVEGNIRLFNNNNGEWAHKPTVNSDTRTKGNDDDLSQMFELAPVKSGARSAYQLAPFGDGFEFADLFDMFSQRDSKQEAKPNGGEQSIDGLAQFKLDSNLISMYDDQTPIIVNNNNKRKYRTSAIVEPLKKVVSNSESSLKVSTKSRLLDLAGPWNRILSLTPERGSVMKPTRSDNSSGSISNNYENNKTKKQQIGQIGSPIILVPGYGGSRLEAKLDKPNSVHYFCDSKTDNWVDLWINVKQLLPYMIDCLIDNMRLEFDPITNRTHNPSGVDIRVKNGSKVASVEYLNNLQISGFAYFAPVIEQLTKGELGYERELNIRAAPYDFRKAPNELGDYFDSLKESSEQLVNESSDGKPITFICHSMGCNNMLYFFHRQTNEWKSKYVSRLISIAAPWAGSVSAMRAAAIGDDLGMPYLFSESKLLLVQRSLPSTIFLFPHKQAFSGIPLVRSNVYEMMNNINNQMEVIIPELKQQYSNDKQQQYSDLLKLSNESTTNTSSQRLKKTKISEPANGNGMKESSVYTADDFKKFFEDIKHPDGYGMWLNTKDLLGSLEAPGVEVWCLVGGGKRTLARIEYAGAFPTSQSQELYDDGDGTVTIQSAEYCKRWSQEQQQPVHYRRFEADHLAILKDANVLQYIEEILHSDRATNANQ